MIKEFQKNMNNLVKTMKPTVERKDREVTECFFYENTGDCFGRRCFWAQNGTCPFCNICEEDENN